jgi:RimJ/RimL family protein N-acetyltransferase
VQLQPWSALDLPLLRKIMGDPQMTIFLGGPESEDKIVRRQRVYEELARSGEGRMFKIVVGPELQPAGQVGYWEKSWREQVVYEIGWHLLPVFQGLGVATRAAADAVVRARSDGRHRLLHAFPSVSHAASNAICRKLGFTLLEECDFEYPAGNPMRCNDWRLTLW